MSDFQTLVEEVDELPLEDQITFLDLLKNRISEAQRNIFIDNVLKSKNEFDDGNYVSGNSSDLFNELKI